MEQKGEVASPKDLARNDGNLEGQADAAQIAEWKGKYPHGIFAVEADCGKISYFKYPNMTELNCALSEFSLDKPLTAYYELAHILFIGGSERWKDEYNLAHALAVIDAMKECSRACQSRVVKL